MCKSTRGKWTEAHSGVPSAPVSDRSSTTAPPLVAAFSKSAPRISAKYSLARQIVQKRGHTEVLQHANFLTRSYGHDPAANRQ